MKSYYESFRYILDLHSAVAVTATERSIYRVGKQIFHISLSIAYLTNFAAAV
jgi:hypothetical protein